ncbi:nucleotidyltransferase family protein [Rhodanobacter sp. MP1X3]|jgi:molybdenum cofactor cytidylyltransferase|uniref:nucleotidyltransferase family protein n=1 Tax=Rhodanobacter sp. MP1X3 TaxID=2723086 RepID=UPI00161B9AEE|nr:nucleotidyltransferase family protein [Rhodanobacter sp. MP1X3]MBB6244905.1 CTP:molybdopterin cytidylyltransferase MocA [Rhodanobacter sp. MP1X3]
MSHRVENPASPVILLLAAGESLRFGDIKQLVEIQGEPMVRRAARSALEQDIPVVVVTGAYAEQVEAVLDDLPLRLIRFDGWFEGMGSSLAAGVRYLDVEYPQASALLLCLADQPLLDPALLGHMLQRHALTPERLLVSEQNGISGPPVLFPRDCFAALMSCSGPRGAHDLIEREAVRVERFASLGSIDVDTPLDLQHVRDKLTRDRSR